MNGLGQDTSKGCGMKAMQRKLFLAGACLILASCAKAEIGEARYAADQCRRVALIDAASDTPIVGAEDMAVDWKGGRLFLSAYDRRAVEKAVRKKTDILPEGGVYAVALAALFDSDSDTVKARPLIAADEISGGLRPHGLSYDAVHEELVFINRAYQRSGRKWRMTPTIQRIGADGEVYVGPSSPAPCAANGVLAEGDETLATYDHAACDWRAGIENAFRLKRSGVVGKHNQILYRHAAFANGLAQTPGGELALGATREKALVFLKQDKSGLEEAGRVRVPGGPDNLTIAEDGRLVAAVHPSLMRLALNRKLGLGKAPSRIVEIDPDTHHVDLLFDDPKGALFSAATVGVETKDGLVVGSVTDRGVLVCRETP